LRFKLQNLQVELEQSVRNIDKYMYSNEKFRLENKNLKTEIGLYKKNNNSSTAFKLKEKIVI
jgi:regulator of replication initiation timing